MTPGNWSWTDNTTFDFKDWSTSEPKNLSMSCAAVTIQTGYWASSDCFKTKPYVCEISATPSYPVYANCSAGWMYFEPTHSCYVVSGYGQLFNNWTEAEKYCLSQNSHLVSLHNFDEIKFVSSAL
uniref:C-type lectin domain-containing protein n=1 Tax=Panagrolaimus sp. ES5 TaxID=591445 RepID=A0AC34FIV3_9BILA